MSKIETITVGDNTYEIGGGGILPHLVITADTGCTVTATKGQTVITATETSSGIYECDVPEYGIYTITGTKGEESVDKEIEVSVVGIYSIDLDFIPDGSTVLPTDDIQTWLKCAVISKNYTTLSQVLADTETYRLLLEDSNACDYMARSTTWAIQEGQVPTMTSDTTPSGTVIYSGQYQASEAAWKAFDGNTNTHWSSGTSISPYYIGYQFTSSKCIKGLKFIVDDASRIANFDVEASNDNSTWVPLAQNIQNTQAERAYYFNNDNSYLSYRMVCNPSSGATVIISLQFYEDADITTNAEAMSTLGKYDYACNALLSNATWASAINSSTYLDYVSKPLVPTMTSDTAPSGQVVYSSNEQQYPRYQAFDGRTDTFTNPRVGEYIGYKFTSPVRVCKLWIKNANYNSNWIATFKVRGSNDGEIWEDITDVLTNTNQTQAGESYYTFANDNDYLYYSLLIVSGTHQNNYANTAELQFYGRTANSSCIYTAPRDQIYYKLNGSNQVIGTADDNGVCSVTWSDLPSEVTIYSTVAKNPDSLSSDYSKTIKNTPNKTEAYLMPDYGVLYWWGYEGSNLEDCTTANGWALTGTAVAFTAPTHNINSISATSSSDYTWSGIGSKTSLSSSITSISAITTGISLGQYADGQYFDLRANSGKTAPYSEKLGHASITSSAMTKSTASVTSANDFSAFLATPWRSSGTIHALWYE